MLRFFHFRARAGGAVRARARACAATARRAPGQHGLEIVHPSYRVLDDEADAELGERLDPVYPAIEGVGPAVAAQADRRRRSIACRDDEALELLPRDAAATRSTCRRCARRCCTVHRPPRDADVAALLAGTHPAQRRLALEELLAHHLSLRRQRIALQRARRAALAGAGARSPRACARRCRSR